MKYQGVNLSQLPDDEKMPGFTGKFVHTDDMTLAYWSISKGSELPEHHHPHKQIVQVVDGTFEMVIGGEAHTFGPGDVVEIDGNVPHSGKAITDCKINDIFLPARDDYR